MGRAARARLLNERTAIVVVLCATYIVSQFLRSSVGVIAPEISADLSIGPEALGGLSGAFFIAFALAQVPGGLLLDRFGARSTIAGLLLLAIAGSLLFATAESAPGLVTARVLMGVGCATLLMGPLVVYARWFPANRFATLSGIQIAVGSIGTLLATAPLAFGAATIGWRGTFVVVAGVAAAMALLVRAVVRDAPADHAFHTRETESLRDSIAGLGAVVRNPHLPPVLAIQFVAYGAMITVLGLWGGPFLADVHGLGPGPRGEVLFVMSMSLVAGMLVWGPADRLFNSRKKPVVAGAVLSASTLTALAAGGDLPLSTVVGLFAVLGFANGYTAVALAHGRAIFPDHLVGRGITFLNMGNMLGVAYLQGVSGLIAGATDSLPGASASVDGYRLMFAFLALNVWLAVAIYSRATDIVPEPGQESA